MVDDQNKDELMECCGGITECDEECRCDTCMERRAEDYWNAMHDTYD
jgi:hypothetical protein